MTSTTELHPEHNVLMRKLRSISPLSKDEKHCLLTLPLAVKSVGPDQDIVREGDRPSECCLVVQGLTCRYKLTNDGEATDIFIPRSWRHSRPAKHSPAGHGSQPDDANPV